MKYQKGEAGGVGFIIMVCVIGVVACFFDQVHTKGIKDHYIGKFTCETLADKSVECYQTKTIVGE